LLAGGAKHGGGRPYAGVEVVDLEEEKTEVSVSPRRSLDEAAHAGGRRTSPFPA
jgi:hypothetical protein